MGGCLFSKSPKAHKKKIRLLDETITDRISRLGAKAVLIVSPEAHLAVGCQSLWDGGGYICWGL